MPYDYMGVTEYAAMTGRHRNTVLKMICNRTLVDAGCIVQRIAPKKGFKTRRWSIGIPVTEWCCADCGKQWRDDNTTPAECPTCGSKNIERRTKVA